MRCTSVFIFIAISIHIPMRQMLFLFSFVILISSLNCFDCGRQASFLLHGNLMKSKEPSDLH